MSRFQRVEMSLPEQPKLLMIVFPLYHIYVINTQASEDANIVVVKRTINRRQTSARNILIS